MCGCTGYISSEASLLREYWKIHPRVAAAVGRGNLVAQMLFGEQQCFIILGAARLATCVSRVYCPSSQCLARSRPSQHTGSGAWCSTDAETSLSPDLKNDSLPLVQHGTMACPADNCAVQHHGRLWRADGRADGLTDQQVGFCMQAKGAQPGSTVLAGAIGHSTLEGCKVL